MDVRRALAAVGGLLVVLAVSSAQQEPAARAGNYTADRPVDFLHMKLEYQFTTKDMLARTAEARVTFTLTPIANPVKSLRLNAVDMRILDTQVDGKTVPFNYDDKELEVPLATPLEVGRQADVTVHFRVERPDRGLHFVLPNPSDPTKQTVVYTMGEGMDARHWLPAHDWPNERWTSDIFVTTPKGFTAVAYGKLIGSEPAGDTVTWHWKSDAPTDPHMIGFAVGRYVKLEDNWHGKPVLAFVPAGKEAAGRYTFRRVPQILDFYAALTGIDYPYDSFAHAAVTDHHHRGMEHAGFSMIDPEMFSAGPNDDGLEPLEPGWPGYTIETNLVAHMLAHSWFGGIASYRNASQGWLNEGFGTYLHMAWAGHADNEAVFVSLMRGAAQSLAFSDSSETGRPMVWRQFNMPMEVFQYDGGKIYWKGAWIVHMLRNQLGEKVFWGGVKDYLNEHRWGSVETADLRRALEKASGRDLEQFFDQWIYGKGIPRLQAAYRWDPVKKVATLTLRQTQRIAADAPAFSLPVELYFHVGGKDEYRTVQIDRDAQDYPFAFEAAPDAFAVDPGGKLLCALAGETPRAMLEWLAVNGPTSLARIRAAEALGGQAADSSIAALSQVVLSSNTLWPVRQVAANALGRLQMPEAAKALLDAEKTGIAEPRVLGAVLSALAAYPFNVQAHQVLNRYATAHADTKIQAMATRQLGRMKASTELEKASLTLLLASAKSSPRPMVRVAAIQSLEQADAVAAYETISSLAGRPGDPNIRGRAMAALGALGRDEKLRDRTLTALAGWLDDPDFAVRPAAARALGRLGDPRALAPLNAAAGSPRTELEKEALQSALGALRSRPDPRTATPTLVDRLGALEKENAQLKDRLSDLNKRLGALETKKDAPAK
ncbi:M1 family aminopeptidase [uncultured Paludibaculum sp.]|uniref:M1 family aminopeptidase n=1 Tax=uncultured Paludibaculum sp. TaxID=1765020 RepID=UPI002AAC3DC6|nr:M1 family aminopeptidase [uncultured Paludibaculum sp.]